jgi:hypothetical protein
MTQRLDALSIKQINGTDEAELAIIQNQLIENIERTAISVLLKNQNLSGNPEAGSVEVKRHANALSAPYGTARAAAAGVDVKEDKVIILLDQDKEIVEEIEYKDVVAYGVGGMLQRRSGNHGRSMIRELDRAFFAEAVTSGTEFTPSVAADEFRKEVGELLVDLQTTENDFVDGVELEDLRLVLSVEAHDELSNEIVELSAASNITTADGAVGLFKGVPVYVSSRLPAGVKAIGMVRDSVAQPVLFDEYKVEEIPLSKAVGVALFYTYGTKAVTPDLIKYIGTVETED